MKNLFMMSAKEKKDLINKKLAAGDKRSYNEIAADLELELWNERHQGFNYKVKSSKK